MFENKNLKFLKAGAVEPGSGSRAARPRSLGVLSFYEEFLSSRVPRVGLVAQEISIELRPLLGGLDFFGIPDCNNRSCPSVFL